MIERRESERSEAEQRLLELHPDHIFRMQMGDLDAIRRWLASPLASEPPVSYLESRTYSGAAIRDALMALIDRGEIGSVVLNRRTYYGLPATMSNAEDLVGRIVDITSSEPDTGTEPKPNNRLNATEGN